MKMFLKIFCFVLALGLCVCLISYSNNTANDQIRLVENSKTSTPSLRYHFVMVAQDMNDTFWQSVKTGAEKAGKKYDAAVEFDGPVIKDEENELKYLSIAIASNVDGIVVYVTDKTKFTPLINKAIGKGIIVVTIESDDINSKRKAYIGPSNYNVGMSEGSLVAEAENGTSNVALILGGNYAENDDASDSLLKGFKYSISTHTGITLQTVQNSSTGYFGAEKIIRNILYDFPKIDTVVCTNSNDTLEVVQVLIDLNKTSNITVIGYSNSQQIRDYIKSNDIFGSVYETPEDTGYRSIESLANILNGKTVPSVINTGVYTITRNNLLTYSDGS